MNSGNGEPEKKERPAELDLLKTYVGVWEASAEVWPQGLEKESTKFEGVETNQGFGEHWISSNFESTFDGQKVIVHTIIGYDLDQKKLVGTAIDHGPYAAQMVGSYFPEKKIVHWTTNVRGFDGEEIIQKTTITHKSDDERILVLSTQDDSGDRYVKFMEIRFRRRK